MARTSLARRLLIVIVAGLVIGFVAGWLSVRTARCSDCIPTFCGTSSECPGRCVCAIPMGQATGYCAGTR